MHGAIEAGGTKFVCGAGTVPENLETIEIATRAPEETVAAAVAFLRERRVTAVGIASFGPVDLAAGRIASTPKIAWRNFDFVETVRRALGVPVAFDTDVNGAALGEARWGAAAGVSDFLYITVGTGIGGGAMMNGALLHGLAHPEMGHMRIPRDPADAFAGVCPFHGDCLEGLASGPAMHARWGMPPQALPADHPAWALEARYLALAVGNCVCMLSPKLVLMGGGVMQQPQLFPMIRSALVEVLHGYVEPPPVLPPALGARAGVLGALALAEGLTSRQA